MRPYMLLVALFALMVVPAFASSSDTGVGQLVIVDERHVDVVLPDGAHELLENPELVGAIRELLSGDARMLRDDQAQGLGGKILAALKAVIQTSVKIAAAVKKGSVIGWEFGNKFNHAHGNVLVGGAAAFFLGAKAFLVLTGGNPIAAIIGGAVMALGGAQVAEKLELAFNIVFAVGGAAIGAATGALVYVMLPVSKAVLRLAVTLLKGSWHLLKALIHAVHHVTGEAYAWLKAELKELRHVLAHTFLHGGRNDDLGAAIAQLDAILAE